MSRFWQAKAYAQHWLNVVDEHSIHSPFFFDFYSNVVKAESDLPELMKIEALRAQLRRNEMEIKVTDFGAGSAHFHSDKRQLSRITETSLSPRKYCEFYYRILQFLKAERAIELGTSLGVTTLYLGANSDVAVTTFEGSPAIAGIASTNFKHFNAGNIELIEGNLDQTLPEFLQNPAKIDFAFIDANHRYEPLVKYFGWISRRMADKGIMVVDDIHHTPEMHRAWNTLKRSDLVYSSIDFFRCGLLFFDPVMPRHDFVWSLE